METFITLFTKGSYHCSAFVWKLFSPFFVNKKNNVFVLNWRKTLAHPQPCYCCSMQVLGRGKGREEGGVIQPLFQGWQEETAEAVVCVLGG